MCLFKPAERWKTNTLKLGWTISSSTAEFAGTQPRPLSGELLRGTKDLILCTSPELADNSRSDCHSHHFGTTALTFHVTTSSLVDTKAPKDWTTALSWASKHHGHLVERCRKGHTSICHFADDRYWASDSKTASGEFDKPRAWPPGDKDGCQPPPHVATSCRTHPWTVHAGWSESTWI